MKLGRSVLLRPLVRRVLIQRERRMVAIAAVNSSRSSN